MIDKKYKKIAQNVQDCNIIGPERFEDFRESSSSLSVTLSTSDSRDTSEQDTRAVQNRRSPPPRALLRDRVMPLYGCCGTTIVGYVKSYKTGVILW